TPGPVDEVRRLLYRALRGMVAGDRTPVRDLRADLTGDTGLFGPDSITWQVHSDAAMFVGGIRALFLQTMHPLAMAGVADHSNYRQAPLDRLGNTAEYIARTTYGTTRQADETIAAVKRAHVGVHGHAPDGRPYSANDPHLLSWIHHALIDSFLRAYQRYGGRSLSGEDADRYVAENAVVAERFGSDTRLGSVAELNSWMRAERPSLAAGRQARTAARFLVAPPLPFAARPPYAVLAAGAIGLLPGWVRRELRLPLLPLADPVAIRPATWAMTRTLDWAMRSGPDAHSAPAVSAHE
ncbi:MAG: DUF2236 domain-containing protein, partial [Actinomycetota bacterium]|nr:DUF2236 domain-containing protein [Actinomycetota bacterium]